MYSPTGTYEITSYNNTEVGAFVPDSLPPKRNLNISRLRTLLDSALVSIGKLDAISALFPDSELYLPLYIRKESMLSSHIEGVYSSVSDVLLLELDKPHTLPVNEDVIEVANHAKALEYGHKRMRDDNFPLSSRLIKEIHGILLASDRGQKKTPGEFRRLQNWIGGTRLDNARFVPPPSHKLEDCMSDLEKFIHTEKSEYSGLIKIGLTHIQFETIHPFLDGNGRVGRMLIALQLHHEGLLDRPMLYISLYINKHRNEYYRLLDSVRTEGNWEGWLEFFLNAVLESSNDAVTVAWRLSQLFKTNDKKIRKLGRNSDSALHIHQMFQKHPALTLNNISEMSGLSMPTVSLAVKKLEDLDIVDEVTGKKRNRVYLYSEYLSTLGNEFIG